MRIEDDYSNPENPSYEPSKEKRYRLRHPEKIRIAQKKYEQSEKGRKVRQRINRRYRSKKADSGRANTGPAGASQ